MATCRPWRHSTTALMPSCAGRHNTSPSSWATGRRWFPPAASSPATPLTWHRRRHAGAADCRGQQYSWGYLPGVLLTIPVHPQHCHVLVKGWSHMVGRPFYPHVGAGQVGVLEPLQLHFPQWRHCHPSWCSLGGPAAPPGRSASRTSGRSHHLLLAPNQEPFSPARLLGFLHALTGPPQSGQHASAAGLLI